MRKVLFLSLIFFPFLMFSQQQNKEIDKVDENSGIAAKDWLKNILKAGLEIKGDSIEVSEEYLKVMNDSIYRKLVYPEKYTVEGVALLTKKMELKLSFWYFINIYPENDKIKELVLKAVVMYNRLLPMPVILNAAFTTYIYMDPEVSVIENGDSKIIRPDILEEKLRNMNEIIDYLETHKE